MNVAPFRASFVFEWGWILRPGANAPVRGAVEAAMLRTTPFLCLFLAAVFVADAQAAPKKSSTGAACTSTGTERRDGKDEAGNKVNCLFDSCKFCAGPQGELDCSVMKTEYTNPRDCRAASVRPGFNRDLLNRNMPNQMLQTQ